MRQWHKCRMILPFLFLFLCATLAESRNAGDSCRLITGDPGICRLLEDCEPIFQKLLNGKIPEIICAYSPSKDPLVCCPTNSSTNITTSPPVSTSSMQGDGRGAIAKQKCAEYSQYVYALKYQPFLNKTTVNVSSCAIKLKRLVPSGIRAERMEFPHMAAVGYNLETGDIGWYCSGTLISETFVLTAAHCTNSMVLGNATWVRLGDLNLVRSDDGATPENRRIIQRIRHPDYKPPSQYHDIALLRFETGVPFNGWIRPACLHTSPSTDTKRAIATGWGRIDWFDDDSSDELKKVILPLIDSQTCNASWSSDQTSTTRLRDGVVGDWLICAGSNSTDECQSDSGGPLVIYSKPEYYCMYDVVGVTSFGKSCGSKFPGIYTRVYNYVPWIESIVWGAR